MSKLASMTIGLVLIFLGLQLVLVKSWLLTPMATEFLEAEGNGSAISSTQDKDDSLFGGIFGSSGSGQPSIRQAPAGQSWPYYQTNSGNSAAPNFDNSSWRSESSAQDGQWLAPGKRFVPPRWLSWPPLFLGIVFFLHGLALRH